MNQIIMYLATHYPNSVIVVTGNSKLDVTIAQRNFSDYIKDVIDTYKEKDNEIEFANKSCVCFYYYTDTYEPRAVHQTYLFIVSKMDKEIEFNCIQRTAELVIYKPESAI